MKKLIKKINYYFFYEENPSLEDQVWLYGTCTFGIIATLFCYNIVY